MPLVSIIIPAYNASKYIEQCLSSIVQQEFKDWELYIVDDGSTDSTPLICENFTSDNRITLITKANQGVSAARNEGLKRAKGTYVMFVDADDILPCDALISFYSAYTQCPDADLIRGEYCAIDSNGIELFSTNNKVFRKNRIHIETDVNVFIRKYIRSEYFLWLMWIKRAKTASEIFNQGQIYMEDADFLFKIFSKTTKCIYIPEITYYYRKTEDAASGKMSEKKINDIVALAMSLNEARIDRRNNDNLTPNTYNVAINNCWNLVFSHITNSVMPSNGILTKMRGKATRLLNNQDGLHSIDLEDFASLDYEKFRQKYRKRQQAKTLSWYIVKISTFIKSKF